MTLPEDSPFVIGLRSDGLPQPLYELEDGTLGFLGHDTVEDRLVEIHRLPGPNAIWQNQFDSILERLKQAEKLRHPNLACVLETGVDADDHHFYVTEFVEGERLRIWLERVTEESGSIPRQLGLSLTLQLADLVAFLGNRPRLLASINLDDFAVALDRGHFLQLRLTDFGFDREEHPIRDTGLAARWIQTTAILLQHLFDGQPLPDPEILLEAATQPMVEGPLRSLITDLHQRPDSVAFGELAALKANLIRAFEQSETDNRHQTPKIQIVSESALVPKGPLFSLMRDSPEFPELAQDRWEIDGHAEFPGPDGLSPFSIRAKAEPPASSDSDVDSAPTGVDLEFLPPERLVDNGSVSRLTSKMQHPYLKKHPSLVRTRSLYSETDFVLVANEAVHGFSLISLMAHRQQLGASEVCHLARQIERLLIHLDDATTIEYGGLDPWRLMFHFEEASAPEQIGRLISETPVTDWSGGELRLRIESVADALVEPVCSSWRYLLENRMNRKPLAALMVWLQEAGRFDKLLAESRADSEPLSWNPALDELFRNAASFLDEREPAQRKRFLEMLEAKTTESRNSESDPEIETTAESPPVPAKPKRAGLFRRQRSVSR